ANGLGLATGNSAVSVFNTIVHRLGPEIEGAYLAGGGPAGDRGTTQKDFDANLGYTQLKDNIQVSAKLFRWRIGQNEYQWSQIMGKQPMPFTLSPEAEHAFQQISGADSQGNRPGASGGPQNNGGGRGPAPADGIPMFPSGKLGPENMGK